MSRIFITTEVLLILRIFSHPNVLPVIGAVNDSKHLIVLSQYLPFGSLYNVLHEGTGEWVHTPDSILIAFCKQQILIIDEPIS